MKEKGKSKKAKTIRQTAASFISRVSYNLYRLSEKQFLFLLLTFDFCLRLWRVWEPGEPYFDEGPFYLKTARGFLQGVTTLNPEHPPLAKLIIAASIQIFGDNPFGWRLPGVLLGTVAVATTYFLAKRLTGSRKVASIAAILLTFEFGWFVASRVATIEIYLASFLLIGSFFVVKMFQESKLINILPAGIFLGAALASKWSAALLVTWLILFLLLFWKQNWQLKAATIFSLVGIIFGVYLASYLPYLTSHSSSELVRLQEWMFRYHTGAIATIEEGAKKLASGKIFAYSAWSWFSNFSLPLVGKTFAQEAVQAILFLYNPILLWGGAVSLLVLAAEQFKRFQTTSVFLIGSFAFLYLPWLFSPRHTLNYYFLSAIPFLAIGFSLFLSRFWKKKREWVYLFVFGAEAAFWLYYPMLSYLKIPYFYGRILSGIVEFVRIV